MVPTETGDLKSAEIEISQAFQNFLYQRTKRTIFFHFKRICTNKLTAPSRTITKSDTQAIDSNYFLPISAKTGKETAIMGRKETTRADNMTDTTG